MIFRVYNNLGLLPHAKVFVRQIGTATIIYVGTGGEQTINLPDGEYFVLVCTSTQAAEGYYKGCRFWIRVTNGVWSIPQITLLEQATPPQTAVAFKVYEGTSNTPLAGATVTIFGAPPSETQIASGQTDVTGLYTYTLPPGQNISGWTAIISYPNYNGVFFTIDQVRFDLYGSMGVVLSPTGL
jgi:hypothetical protein